MFLIHFFLYAGVYLTGSLFLFVWGQGRAGQGREVGGRGGGLSEEAKFPKLASHRRKDGRLIIPRIPIPTA